jgi:beta-glucosidase
LEADGYIIDGASEAKTEILDYILNRMAATKTFQCLFPSTISRISTLLLAAAAWCAFAQQASPPAAALKGPWMDKSLSADRRADLLLQAMTLGEKLQLVYGLPARWPKADPRSFGGSSYVPGIPRLGIPDLQMSDGRSGVCLNGYLGRYATALPSALCAGASWDLRLAYEYGSLVGKEGRDIGYNVSLGGTANLIREPRNGRNFECWSEDPVLAGKMLGQDLKGTQDRKIIGNINRFAVNDQETGRSGYQANLEKRALWETDLLAFLLAIRDSQVGTVMCAYNRFNGEHCCENSYLLTDVLKKAWNYKGWVMSDWGGTHSGVKAALAGLDQEMPTGKHFAALEEAIEKRAMPMARIDDMVHRILRTEIAVGIFDDPPVPHPVNPFTGAEVAQRVAEKGIVLLKNDRGQLPLDAARIGSIALIGSHADVGVLAGGGSDQVDPAGGNAASQAPPSRKGRDQKKWSGLEWPATWPAVWHPSSPLKAVRAKAPRCKVTYDPGTDLVAAAKLAAASGVAIVFVNQHTTEGRDEPDLSLPDSQDELVRRVASANKRTIVVLENGGPVLMPWLGEVSAVVEAWYPGIRGAEAIANVLFGEVNPSGRLPVSFPKSEADLPHPEIAGWSVAKGQAFDVNYTEGFKVGYKWFDAEDKTPLFSFGFGISYTSFSYSGLRASAGDGVKVTFTVRNTGKRAGTETPQVYAALPASAGEPPKRLVAWDKIDLAPGEAKQVTLHVEPFLLAVYNAGAEKWELPAGDYAVFVGNSSRHTPLSATIHLDSLDISLMN